MLTDQAPHDPTITRTETPHACVDVDDNDDFDDGDGDVDGNRHAGTLLRRTIRHHRRQREHDDVLVDAVSVAVRPLGELY